MPENEEHTEKYSLVTPSLAGVISDDYLYFEGVRKPGPVGVLRDGIMNAKDVLILERYWNDMYNLFLRKLTQFAGKEGGNDGNSLKLQALLQELIRVRELIENAPKTDIMGK